MRTSAFLHERISVIVKLLGDEANLTLWVLCLFRNDLLMFPEKDAGSETGRRLSWCGHRHLDFSDFGVLLPELSPT